MSNDTVTAAIVPSSGEGTPESVGASPEPYDAIVIGAGFCGIVFLAYARKMGLNCIALEKQNDVGGLWSRLPAWQDIQNLQQDIALDGVPLRGVDQPAMQQYAREWVRRFRLEPCLRLGREVTGVSREDGRWTVRTRAGETFRAKHLVAASGVQNQPWIPEVDRSDSGITENHSFDLRRPESLAGQRVTVVGAGASSQDLLELAIKNGARDIHWVYRNEVKWFIPTMRKKQLAWPNLRELGVLQSIRGTRAANALMRWLLEFAYDHFGLSGLAPDKPFDFNKHQLIPGRATLIRNIKTVTRHRAHVRALHGHELILSNGERVETDRVLWGTGYTMDLAYLGLPEYQRVRRPEELFPKLGSLVRSLDYPDLFFLGMTINNTSNSTPYGAAIEAKTIISHIRGECEIPERVLPHHLTYWDEIRYFATFDRANYPGWWKLKYLGLALWFEALHNRSLRVGARRVEKNGRIPLQLTTR